MKALLLGLALMSLFLFPQTARSQLFAIPTCVEVTRTDVPVSARRRGTGSDCDPATAKSRAIVLARTNASNALALTCRARTTRAMAQRACATIGKTPTSSFDVDTFNPVGTAGSTRPDAAIGIGQTASGLHLCTVLRDLPNEASISTTPATINNGFCIFNNNRVTNFTARARARCAVTCS